MSQSTASSRVSILLALCAIVVASLSAMYSWSSRVVESEVSDVAPQAVRAETTSEAQPDLGSLALNTEQTQTIERDQQRATIRLPVAIPPADIETLEAEAKFMAERLLQDMPEEPIAVHVSAMLNAKLHNTELAIEQWKKCIEMSPRTEQYYVNLASVALDRGQSELAIETLMQAQTMGLYSPDIAHHLGLAHMNAGNNQEALEILEGAAKEEGQSGALWFLVGQVKLRAGDSAGAEEALRRAVDLGVKTRQVYFNLFSACMRNGNREDAAEFRTLYESFKPKKRIEPSMRFEASTTADARSLIAFIAAEAAMLYDRRGSVRDTEHLLLRSLALSPVDLNVLSNLADFLSAQQRFADERIVRERIVSLNSQQLLDYLLLAKAEVACGNPEAAEAAIKLAIALGPTSPTSYIAMAEFLVEQKRAPEAEWYARRVVELDRSPEAYRLLARVHRLQGDEAAAQSAEAEISQMQERE
ncbi:MAG TPA: hypothetical protein DDW52_10275 [Planctomycetaceae bacterium]|nr:hypothetical protein [Planctomycetaceae bacterium]